MTKNVIVAVAVLTLAAIVSAQTPTHKPVQVVRPNTNAPTKVTGDGVKTDSGLQYWDIKVGLGREEPLSDAAAVTLIPFMLIVIQYTVDAERAAVSLRLLTSAWHLS